MLACQRGAPELATCTFTGCQSLHISPNDQKCITEALVNIKEICVSVNSLIWCQQAPVCVFLLMHLWFFHVKYLCREINPPRPRTSRFKNTTSCQAEENTLISKICRVIRQRTAHIMSTTYSFVDNDQCQETDLSRHYDVCKLQNCQHWNAECLRGRSGEALMQAATDPPGQIKFICPSLFPAPSSTSLIAKQQTRTTRTLVCAGTFVTFYVAGAGASQITVKLHQQRQKKAEVKSAD